MSLLNDYARLCVLIEKKRVPDGGGGYRVEWAEGAEFESYQELDTTMEARIAEGIGVTSTYSALVRKDVPIEYGDYFKDKSTDTIYRVTSRPEDKEAPKSASPMIRMLKYFTAERAELT